MGGCFPYNLVEHAAARRAVHSIVPPASRFLKCEPMLLVLVVLCSTSAASDTRSFVGHCGATVDVLSAARGLPRNATVSLIGCEEAQSTDSGVFPLSRASWQGSKKQVVDECVRLCSLCSSCRAVSLSQRYKDCSWYATCSPQKIRDKIKGFRTVLMPAVPAHPALPVDTGVPLSPTTSRELRSSSPCCQLVLVRHIVKMGGSSLGAWLASTLRGRPDWRVYLPWQRSDGGTVERDAAVEDWIMRMHSGRELPQHNVVAEYHVRSDGGMAFHEIWRRARAVATSRYRVLTLLVLRRPGAAAASFGRYLHTYKVHTLAGAPHGARILPRIS